MVLLVVAFAMFEGGAEAEPGPEEAYLEMRLARLEARDDVQYVEGAIAKARHALDAKGGALEDGAARARANRIADAAMTFAERELDRREVQRQLLETQRRLTATRERAAAQRRVLEALMKERAALAREAHP